MLITQEHVRKIATGFATILLNQHNLDGLMCGRQPESVEVIDKMVLDFALDYDSLLSLYKKAYVYLPLEILEETALIYWIASIESRIRGESIGAGATSAFINALTFTDKIRKDLLESQINAAMTQSVDHVAAYTCIYRTAKGNSKQDFTESEGVAGFKQWYKSHQVDIEWAHLIHVGTGTVVSTQPNTGASLSKIEEVAIAIASVDGHKIIGQTKSTPLYLEYFNKASAAVDAIFSHLK